MNSDQSEKGIVRIDKASVEWTDSKVETTFDQPVDLLPNGWIHFPGTGQYYPDHEIEKVVDLEKEPEGSNHVF